MLAKERGYLGDDRNPGGYGSFDSSAPDTRYSADSAGAVPSDA